MNKKELSFKIKESFFCNEKRIYVENKDVYEL